MNEVLDNDFGSYRGALSEEDLKTLEGKIPYGVLRGQTLSDVCVLLGEAEISYLVQPQEASTNGTGIIPLASTQLNLVDTLVYIDKDKKQEVDALIAQYEAQKAAEPVVAPSVDGGINKVFLWGAILIGLLILFLYTQAVGF